MTVVNSNQTASAPGISSPPTQPWYAYPPPYNAGVQAATLEPLQNFQLEQNEIENTNELITSPQVSHQDEANEQSVQQVNVG